MWYDNLKKPAWTPKPDTISTIWMILYPIMFISFGIVFYQAFTGEIPWFLTIPFLLNILFNIAFTPVLFVKRNILLATVDIYCVVLTLAWAALAMYRFNPTITYAQIHYFGWVCIATVL